MRRAVRPVIDRQCVQSFNPSAHGVPFMDGRCVIGIGLCSTRSDKRRPPRASCKSASVGDGASCFSADCVSIIPSCPAQAPTSTRELQCSCRLWTSNARRALVSKTVTDFRQTGYHTDGAYAHVVPTCSYLSFGEFLRKKPSWLKSRLQWSGDSDGSCAATCEGARQGWPTGPQGGALLTVLKRSRPEVEAWWLVFLPIPLLVRRAVPFHLALREPFFRTCIFLHLRAVDQSSCGYVHNCLVCLPVRKFSSELRLIWFSLVFLMLLLNFPLDFQQQ